jgi:hypothetical protein
LSPSEIAGPNLLPVISTMLYGNGDGALDHLGYHNHRPSVLFNHAWVTVLGREIGCHTRRDYPNVALAGTGWIMQFTWDGDAPARAVPTAFEGDETLCRSDLAALRAALEPIIARQAA